MSSVALGLRDSFVWPGSGGGSLASAGVSQLGNLRMARAGNSAVTGGQPDGFLLLNQNHISLHHIGSSWTGLLTHSAMADHGSGGRWLTQSGTLSSMISGTDGAFGTKNVTFPTVYGTAPPYIQLSVDTTRGYWFNISAISTGGFSTVYASLVGPTAITTLSWEAEGLA